MCNHESQAQNIQFNLPEVYSSYACSVESLVNRGWPEFCSKLCNRENVFISVQGVPYIIISIAIEKKLRHHTTVDKPVNPIETLENNVNNKHLAYEMTPEAANAVTSLAPQ